MGKLAFVFLVLGILAYFKFSSASGEAISGSLSNEAVTELKNYGNPTGKTLVCFGAHWCPGCRQLEPQLEQFVRSNADYTLKKIDIVSWDSEIARKFAIRSIPYVVLLENGEIQAEGKAVFDRLNEASRR